MADRWYYSHDLLKLGPCSGQEMKDLADAGGILPTDTVWKEGIARGVVASKVKHLFLPAAAPSPDLLPLTEVTAASPPPAIVRAEVPPAPAPVEPLAAPAPVPPAASAWQQPARKGRATAGRGAVIVSQDGVNVKYRKKCTTCQHVDSSWNTAPIRSGVMRSGYYCPKCRKHREVEVHGLLH